MYTHSSTYTLVMAWQQIALPRKNGKRKKIGKILRQNLEEPCI